MQKNLTPKQQALLDAFHSLTQRHGRAPSYKELQKQLGYSSTASIWRFVQTLKKKGLLADESRHWNSLKATEPPIRDSSNTVEVELIGQIVREKPPVLFAKSTTFTLPSSLVYHKEGCYGLIIEDTSYRDLHLLPYDLIIVEPRVTISPGELVIASNTETIIGHMFDEGELMQFRSSPYSSKTFHDNLIRVEADTIHIWGVIIATIRSLSFLEQIHPR
jgi:SOS-response transcriptional repressor LexA